MVVVEPFIDKATQQSQYRIWQKEGEIVAATIMGTSLASLFGVVFAYSPNSMPFQTIKQKHSF